MSKITDRQKDLSLKFLNMGNALTKEGVEKKDFTITSIGNYLTFISTIIYSERDLLLFNQLTNMIGSRNLVERIKNGDFSEDELSAFNNQDNGNSNETIPNMVKRMNDDYFNKNDDDDENHHEDDDDLDDTL